MSKIILLLITVIVFTLSLFVILTYIVTAVNEKDLLSLINYCFLLSVVLIIIMNLVAEIFKK